MSEGAIVALDGRVTNLERMLQESLSRIEGLIRQEIQDLKTEQLTDIKKSMERVERDMKDQFNRLADDQRRLWDRVTNLENRENQRTGSTKAVGSIGHLFSALFGGIVAAVVAWLSAGRAHP